MSLCDDSFSVEFLTEEYANCVAGVVASLLELLCRCVVMALDATFLLRAMLIMKLELPLLYPAWCLSGISQECYS